jgi:HK97 family phage major capsid protein
MDLKTLREEFATLHGQCNAAIETAAKAGKPLAGDDKQEYDRRIARLDEIKALVDQHKQLAAYAFSAGDVNEPASPQGRQEFDANNRPDGKPVKLDIDAYKRAVNQFCRTGNWDRQLFAVTTGTQSGVMLPKEVLQPVEVRRLQNAIRKVLAYYNLTPIQRTLAEQISLPVSDDTGNVGQQQAEGATNGTTADASFASSVTLNPVLYTSHQLWFSNTQVSAVDWDVFSYALPVLQKRVDKSQESAWTTTLMGGTVGKTTASGTAITYPELLAWEASLPAAYRDDGAFILSDSLYQLIRGLTDNNGSPIMDVDPTNVFQQRIHGKPFAISDYFQTVASGHKSGAFVSAEALKVMDVMNARIARYTLVPSNPDQTGFELFQNGDFGFDPNGVRLLAHT